MSLAITDLTPQEIAETLDLKPFQGKQIFQWLHRKQIFDFDAMTNLSKSLREDLASRCVPAQLELLHLQVSPESGTKKALFKLQDGETIESVLLRDGERRTLCVSSQVGCAVKCSFCATGLAGFTRNLSPGEIVEQVLNLITGEDLEARTPNIVYMGMGEPFRNYDAVMKSLQLLMHPEGLNIGARKITVSTVGDVKQIARFAQEHSQVRLSVSLHAANNTLRSELVPMNRRYPLERLRDALMQYQELTGRQITFEWAMLRGVNDSIDDAQELLAFMRGIKASVNLIPWNPVPGLPYDPPSPERCAAFKNVLIAQGIQTTIRQERGQDIEAACGQLRRTHGA